MTIRAVVAGIGHYLPQNIVTNADLEKIVDTSDEWIKSRSGIERRHFVAKGETTSDLAAAAARAALLDANLSAGDIDAIVLATSTADLTFPSAATMVQAKIGMRQGFAFDVQAVCAGFIYALSTANALILSGQAKRVLVIGAESFSKLMDWQDRTTSVLFGDGAGALVLEADETATGTNTDWPPICIQTDNLATCFMLMAGPQPGLPDFCGCKAKKYFAMPLKSWPKQPMLHWRKRGLGRMMLIGLYLIRLICASSRPRHSEWALRWSELWSRCKIMAIRRRHRFLWPYQLEWHAGRSNVAIFW
jgi:hypothetical protein